MASQTRQLKGREVRRRKQRSGTMASYGIGMFFVCVLAETITLSRPGSFLFLDVHDEPYTWEFGWNSM